MAEANTESDDSQTLEDTLWKLFYRTAASDADADAVIDLRCDQRFIDGESAERFEPDTIAGACRDVPANGLLADPMDRKGKGIESPEWVCYAGDLGCVSRTGRLQPEERGRK